MTRIKALLALLGLHTFLLIKLKFTAWPEMIFWPYLILKGWLPYADIAIAHTPLLLAGISGYFRIFGLGLIQLKIFTWILILATDLLLFWIAKKLWDKKTALLSLFLYIPLQLFYEGNSLWFDLALVPLAILIYYSLEKKNYLLAGIIWGIAFFTKQTTIWFLIPIIFSILQRPLKEAPLRVIDPSGSVTYKNIRRFVFAAGVIVLIFFINFQILGIWREFWLWAFKFGITKLPTSSGQIYLPMLKQIIIATFPIILMILITLRFKRNYNLILWTIFASLGVFPRWELFHFQPALPFLAIGLAVGASSLSKLILIEQRIIKVWFLLMALILIRQILRDWGGQTRFFEPEVYKIAEYIRQNSEKNDQIYIINAWDSLYALSETLPATSPWLPHLSWYMEIPGIQEAVVANLKVSQPKLIVQGEYQETGLGAYKPEKINNFILENYDFKEKIDGHLILVPKQ